jgi:epoxide hydrolase-like predicted phosphatase
MYKAVIFDFFGVFCPDITLEWFKQTVPDFESKLPDFRAFCTQSDYGKLSKHAFFQNVSALAGVSSEDMIRGVEAQTVINTKLVDYVRNTIKLNYKTACLSNGTHEWTLHVITEHGIGDLFEEIVLSGDLGTVKPNPEIYHATLEKLGVGPEESVFIDDRQSNIEGAEALGIKSILFTDTETLINEFESVTP